MGANVSENNLFCTSMHDNENELGYDFFSIMQASMEMEIELSTSTYLISMKTYTMALCVFYISWMEINFLLFLAC